MEELERRVRALGCPCRVKLFAPSRDHGEDVIERAVAEILRIEHKYSRYRDDSVISEINASAGTGSPTRVDDETAAMLDFAETVFRESKGLFDITSGILRQAWDFKTPRLPDPELLRSLCRNVGWRKVEWHRPHFALPETGMEIDFGGFGKEYAADRVADVCLQGGIRHGIVDLGGDIRIIGPNPDGSPWRFGICDPREPSRSMASLPMSHGAIATSGDYERFFELDGRRYCHILDPCTGQPIRGLSAVSVVSEHCLIAGTSATIALLKGRQGARWLSKLGLPHLWVDAKGRRGGSLWPRATKTAPAPPAVRA